MACNVCIPTGNRNKHLNRCTNLWSAFVVIGLLLGVAGALLMALTTKEITDKQYVKVRENIDMMNRIGSGDPDLTADEVVAWIDEMPAEQKDMICDSMGDLSAAGITCEDALSPAMIQLAYAGGYDCDLSDPTGCEDEFGGDIYVHEDWDTAFAEEHEWTCEDCMWYDEHDDCGEWYTVPCEDIRRRLENHGSETDSPVADHGGGLPRMDDMDQFDKYQKAGLLALMIVGLMGPILTTFGMIFFCCQLKALSNDVEGRCESCCGTIMGCVVFPVVFIVGAVLSIFAAVFMNFMCVFITMPFVLANVMAEARFVAQGVAHGALDANAGLGFMMNSILPLMIDAAKALDGSLCEKDGSYLMREVLDNDPKLCKGWLMAYRFGTAAQIIACVFSIFGVLITVYVGYKACCRNNRDSKTDVEMA